MQIDGWKLTRTWNAIGELEMSATFGKAPDGGCRDIDLAQMTAEITRKKKKRTDRKATLKARKTVKDKKRRIPSNLKLETSKMCVGRNTTLTKR